MTTDDEPKTKKYRASKGGALKGSGELMTGVTGKNYGDKGSLFIQMNPDKAEVIVRRASTVRDTDGNPFTPTEDSLRKWGAWLAYYERIGYRTHFMLRRDYWTAPAAWPHLFDAEATVAADYLAADLFIEALRKERNQFFEVQHPTAEARARIKTMVDTFRRTTPSPPPLGAEPRKSFIDEDLLMKSYDIDYAAMVEKREKRRGSAKKA